MRGANGADFVDGDDVGMIQRRSSLCFLNKAAHPRLISSDIGRQNLQRHLAIEVSVLRQIYLSHSTRAYLRDDDVVCERRVGGYRFAQGVMSVSFDFVLSRRTQLLLVLSAPFIRLWVLAFAKDSSAVAAVRTCGHNDRSMLQIVISSHVALLC